MREVGAPTCAAACAREREAEARSALEAQLQQLRLQQPEPEDVGGEESAGGAVGAAPLEAGLEIGSAQSSASDARGSAELEERVSLAALVDKALLSGDAALARAVWAGAEREDTFGDAEVEACEGRLEMLAVYVEELDAAA